MMKELCILFRTRETPHSETKGTGVLPASSPLIARLILLPRALKLIADEGTQSSSKLAIIN